MFKKIKSNEKTPEKYWHLSTDTYIEGASIISLYELILLAYLVNQINNFKEQKAMKKLNFKMVFMAAMLVSAAAFISCSNDDENDSKGSETTSKRIAKITYDDGYEIDVTTFGYDAQGRVVQKKETQMEGDSERAAITIYTYGESTIISKTQGDFNDGETRIYTLSGGKIVKENRIGSNSYTNDYTYDDNGYLISQVYVDDSEYQDSGRKRDFTWADGNLTRISSNIISYSNIPWPENWMFYWNGTGMDIVLEPLGAWGKMPKNLPAKIDNGDYEIDYIVENDEITKFTIREIGSSYMEIYTIEWE